MTVQLVPTIVRINEDVGEVVVTVLKQGTSEINTTVNIDTKDATALGIVTLDSS